MSTHVLKVNSPFVEAEVQGTEKDINKYIKKIYAAHKAQLLSKFPKPSRKDYLGWHYNDCLSDWYKTIKKHGFKFQVQRINP